MHSPEFSSANKIYEAAGLQGPALDFERIFQSASRTEALLTPGMEKAKKLYDEVITVIDAEKFPIEGAHIQDIIQAIRSAAKADKWESYETIRFDSIRKELTGAGIPLRTRKTSKDFQ